MTLIRVFEIQDVTNRRPPEQATTGTKRDDEKLPIMGPSRCFHVTVNPR
jgi:hypothetical protein